MAAILNTLMIKSRSSWKSVETKYYPGILSISWAFNYLDNPVVYRLSKAFNFEKREYFNNSPYLLINLFNF